jgi:hypothetical protein
MTDKPEIWVSHGNTESGDPIAILLWPKMPLRSEVKKVYMELYPDEYEEVGQVYFDIELASWGNK